MYRYDYIENSTFSEAAEAARQFSDPQFLAVLNQTSMSQLEANQRQQVYSQVMENYDNLKEVHKSFSGYAEIPLQSNQYFNATMASWVRSFSGFFAVERAMDQPTALLWYPDLLGVSDNRVVLPNLGAENLKNINARFQAQGTANASAPTQVLTNKKLIPGSVEIHLIHVADPKNPIVIKDDRNGNLLAPAGILQKLGSDKEVNYATGQLKFHIGAGFNAVSGDMYSITAFEDVAGTPDFGIVTGHSSNRFKVDSKNITLTADPDMLIAENNLMAIAAAQKAMGMNPQEVSGQKLTELYTKLINEKQVSGIVSNAQGNSVTIQMSRYLTQFTDYNSRLDAFQADLVQVDTALAKNTTKATKATAYLVGREMGDWFRKLRGTGNWVDNTESTYINDLLGYFNGVPVLRHLNVADRTGYAVHKTANGEMAPLMRGIYLPLTNTPIIGNYHNPTQFAQGIYYQEANACIFPELIQKFEIDA